MVEIQVDEQHGIHWSSMMPDAWLLAGEQGRVESGMGMIYLLSQKFLSVLECEFSETARCKCNKLMQRRGTQMKRLQALTYGGEKDEEYSEKEHFVMVRNRA